MPAFVFLGAPGVGKGTYSVRAAAALGAAHVSAGDLVRAEIRAGTPLGKEMAATVARGDLLPDATVAALVEARLRSEAEKGAVAAVLDGYPRTASQAAALLAPPGPSPPVHVAGALNLTLREQALIDKCLGRRTCSRCGAGFNVADIWLPPTADGRPAVVMPPLPPPPECAAFMEVRADDNPATVRRRLEVYAREAAPVEAAFEAAGLLARLELTGGIRESLPAVLAAVSQAGGPAIAALLEKEAGAPAAPAKAKGGCGLKKAEAAAGVVEDDKAA